MYINFRIIMWLTILCILIFHFIFLFYSIYKVYKILLRYIFMIYNVNSFYILKFRVARWEFVSNSLIQSKPVVNLRTLAIKCSIKILKVNLVSSNL